MNKHQYKFLQLSLNIAYYRKKKSYSQEQLAEIIGISRTHMSNIEAVNVSKSVSLKVIFDIADALDVKIDRLFEER